ncbi:DNA alkylation repair protein [Gordonia sp. NPDC003585]|uniref:DNA alkylation repair protein n=1 Tax=Gordonia sp. NPDC003585 TaxID=3154275 RepID=UPI0033ACA5F4
MNDRPVATAAAVMAAAAAQADPERAVNSARFFQAKPGGYGEGDEFIGLTVPLQRRIAKQFRGIGADAIVELLASPVHEHRLIALFCLRAEFDRAADDAARERWIELYLAAVDRGRVNNWDLVDSSADPILGEYLHARDDRKPLVELAAQQDLWRRRVGIIGTFAFIKHGDATATLAVAPLVIDDRRDLVQKAFGWMLREVGKRVDPATLSGYLEDHAAQMGRTALSYAIEHLPPERRTYYRSLR